MNGIMTNSEAIEKIKSTNAEIIVCGKVKKPYFQIRYFDLSDHETHVGYGSYKLEFVFQWLEECFEIIKENPIDNDIPLITPISIEQYAEENTKLKAEIERLIELMPKICETCEYEDEIGWKEPCNSCKNGNNWKLEGKVEE